MSILGIIPAKGYSERFKGCKNLALWRGKSLVQRAIDSASICDEVVVLSNSHNILNSIHGATEQYISIADEATVLDTLIACALGRLKFDHLMLLLPTCPKRTEEHVNEAVDLVEMRFFSQLDGVVSVCRTWPVSLSCGINKNGTLDPSYRFLENSTRQQDQPECYRPNGAIYIRTMEAWRRHQNFFEGKIWPYIMSQKDSVDIDYPEDLEE